MTERLADISARIDGMEQLGAVMNAMKGIAAARARTARTQIDAVDSYAATIAAAMSSAIGPDRPPAEEGIDADSRKLGLLVFCAEQGFAGAFSERVLDSIGDELNPATLLLIGTRGLSVAHARDFAPVWSAAMPSHTPGISKLADGITKALFRQVDEGRINQLDVLFTGWKSGRPAVVRQALFPLDESDLLPAPGNRPLMQIPLDSLIDSLGTDYIHALISRAALHAFAAENEARMEAMSAAGNQIVRELETFKNTLRRIRQEVITAEIIELGTGAASPA